MQHQRVQWIERPALDHIFKGRRISIGDPLLPRRAHSGEVVVFAAAPRGIGIAQPEGRRVCARGQIDIQIRLGRAHITDQRDGSFEIAAKLAARNRLRGTARAVNFELIHAVVTNHVQTHVVETLVVDRSRKRKPL